MVANDGRPGLPLSMSTDMTVEMTTHESDRDHWTLTTVDTLPPTRHLTSGSYTEQSVILVTIS